MRIDTDITCERYRRCLWIVKFYFPDNTAPAATPRCCVTRVVAYRKTADISKTFRLYSAGCLPSPHANTDNKALWPFEWSPCAVYIVEYRRVFYAYAWIESMPSGRNTPLVVYTKLSVINSCAYPFRVVYVAAVYNDYTRCSRDKTNRAWLPPELSRNPANYVFVGGGGETRKTYARNDRFIIARKTIITANERNLYNWFTL